MPFSPGTSGNPSGRPREAHRFKAVAKPAKRDTAGRFQLGTAGGPGRPKRETEQNYLLALVDACPLSKWSEIVARAVEDATAGDDKARHWLASYLVGQPTTKAPAPSSALVGRMLGKDPVLDEAAHRLAMPQASAAMFPILENDSAHLRQLEDEARQFLLSREHEASEPCQEP